MFISNTIHPQQNTEDSFHIDHVAKWLLSKFHWSIIATESLDVPTDYQHWVKTGVYWYVQDLPYPIWVVETIRKDLQREEEILNIWAQKHPKALVIWKSQGKKIWKFGWLEKQESHLQRCSLMMGLPQLDEATSQILQNFPVNISVESLRKFFRQDNSRAVFSHQYSMWKNLAEDILTPVFHQTSVTPTDNSRVLIEKQRNHLFLQVVGIYFLQLKGWLGVIPNQAWGSGNRNFLTQEWEQIQESQSNFWLLVLRPLIKSIYDGRGVGVQFGHIQLPHLSLPFFNPELLHTHGLDNDLFWHPKTGLLTILCKTPLYLGHQPDFNQYIAINENILGTLLEESLERDNGPRTESYYTNPSIARELCLVNVENYLFNNLTPIPNHPLPSKQDIQNWLQYGLVPSNLNPFAVQLDSLLKNIRVCDPAMGVGALLVAMLEVVSTLRKQLNPEMDITNIKYELLCTSLFGMDTNSNAILIAQMRLWCSWVQDCKSPRQFVNLERSFVVGNSLVNKPFGRNLINSVVLNPNSQPSDLQHPMAHNIYEIRDALFQLFHEYPRVPFEEAEEAYAILRGYIWKLALLTTSEPIPLEQAKEIIHEPEKFGLWEWTFFPIFYGPNPGFDIVLCHPPSLHQFNGPDAQSEAITEQFQAIQQQFISLTEDSFDRRHMSYIFVDLVLRITNKRGSCGLLLAETFQFSNLSRNIRDLLIEHTQITHLLSLIPQNSNRINYLPDSQDLMLCADRSRSNTDLTELLFLNNSPKEMSSGWEPLAHRLIVKTDAVIVGRLNQIRILNFKKWNAILEPLEAHSKPLSELLTIHQGLMTGYNRHSKNNLDNPIGGVFVLESETYSQEESELVQHLRQECPELIQPLGRSHTITPFSIAPTTLWVLYLTKNSDTSPEQHPVLWRHLSSLESVLKQRRLSSRNSSKWWELQWPRDPSIFATDSIVCPARATFNGRRPSFALNTGGYYYSSDCTILTKRHDNQDSNPTDLSNAYLVAILNSALVYWWLTLQQKSTGQHSRMGISSLQLQDLPIPILDRTTQQSLEHIVHTTQNTLSLLSKENREDIKHTLHEIQMKALWDIDQIIYRGLKLSDENIQRIHQLIDQQEGIH